MRTCAIESESLLPTCTFNTILDEFLATTFDDHDRSPQARRTVRLIPAHVFKHSNRIYDTLLDMNFHPRFDDPDRSAQMSCSIKM